MYVSSSYNPAGRSHCRLQNHHGYIKLHHRGMGGSPGDVGAVYGASFSNPYIASPMSQLILQPFRRFTYVTAHSTALPLLHLRHRHFTYFTAHSPTLSPLHLRHSSFYNPSAASPTSQVILQLSVASPTSQALHVLHLASRPCIEEWKNSLWWTSSLQ